MSYIKISELPSLISANLIASNLAILPVVSNISGTNVSYQTTIANIKNYVQNGDFTVSGNLVVNGNTVVIGSNNYTTTDNIIELHVANLSNISEPWTIDDGKDIGIRFHYYDTVNKDAALVFARDTNYLEWYVNGAEGNVTFAGNVYGGLKVGSIVLANTTDATTTSTGTLVSNGGLGVAMTIRAGSIQNTPIGNGTASTGSFTTLGATSTLSLTGSTSSATSLGTSATTGTTSIGGTSQTGNITVGRSTANSIVNISTGIVAANNIKNIYIGTAGATGSNTFISFGPNIGNGTASFGTTTNLIISNTQTSTSTTTGAVQIAGGLGVGGNIYGVDIYLGTLSAATIGNSGATITGATGTFTTKVTTGNLATGPINANGTITVAAVTSNGTITATTLNAATIGNTGADITGTTGTFTTKVTTGNLATGAINANGTATVNALTSNGTITGTNITTSANATSNIGSTTAYYSNVFAVTYNVGTGGIRNSGANATGNIGSSTNYFNTVFAQSTSALYADLAEIYSADDFYYPGTVVVFGGSAEVTVTNKEADTRVAGAVSTDPAYLMNAKSDGVAVALRGKIPVKVIGPVGKGDLLVTSNTAGHATSVKNLIAYDPNAVFAKSMEADDSVSERTIWAVIL